jgi:transcription antitermination factor NusA-like protein
LAVKLTGWRIDIKSASSVEEEKAEAAAAEKEAADLLRIWQWKMRMEIWNRLPRN